MMTGNRQQNGFWRAALGVVTGIAMALVSQARAANCEMQMSTSTIDYGQLSRAELDVQKPEASGISLGTRTATLNVACEQSTTMVLRFDAPSSAGGTFVFAEQGSYVMKISEARLDGRSVALGRVSTQGQALQAAAMVQTFEPGAGVAVVSEGRAARGRHFSAQIEIETRLPPDTLRVRSETQLTGRGQLRLVEQ